MNGFLRRLLNLDTVSQAVGVIETQNKLIQEWQVVYAAREQEIAELRLEHVRNVRDLVSHFLEALESDLDEEELRETLENGLRDLNDHVARMEEHAQ